MVKNLLKKKGSILPLMGKFLPLLGSPMVKNLRIGTRGSPLALVQAEDVRRKILAAHPTLAVDVVPIRTAGDWRPEHKERTFLELGGNKGLFTKELEEALLANHIDIAVHSMKDVATTQPEGLEISTILPRENPRDAFIGRTAQTVDDLPRGATIGTASLRRQAQLLAHRPDLRVIPLRGNVETRLKKLAEGMADATILAMAGLSRLGLTARVSSAIDEKIMLPAAAQGAVGIELRSEDTAIRALLAPLDCPVTHLCITAERALLKVLDGDCKTPIAAHATLDAHQLLTLEAMVARSDGTGLVRRTATGTDAARLGHDLGQQMKTLLPADFFAAQKEIY